MKTEPISQPTDSPVRGSSGQGGALPFPMATQHNAQPIPNPLREQPDFAIPAELEQVIDEIITHYPKKRSASLMLLHAVQERYGYVSRQAVEWIAAKLELEPLNVFELVTFYPMFHRHPTGKYHLKICRTLSCALTGAYKLHEFFLP